MAVNQFGTPIPEPDNQSNLPNGSYPSPYPPSYPPAPGAPTSPMAYPPGAVYPAYPPARTGMSSGAKVAIVVGSVVGGLVVLAILAAVAIPVFLNQQGKSEAKHISVQLPDSVNGWSRMRSSTDDAVKDSLSGMPAGYHAQSATYGDGTVLQTVVIVGAHYMPAAEQRGFLAGVQRSTANLGVQLANVDPGPLGGRMQCGASTDGRITECAFVDAGAFGVIDLAGTGPTLEDTARTIRSQVELRH